MNLINDKIIKEQMQKEIDIINNLVTAYHNRLFFNINLPKDLK
jgi:hypothetical protein